MSDYNPNIPAPNSQVRSGELREQFQALKELHDLHSAQIMTLMQNLAFLDAQVTTLISQMSLLSSVVPVGGIIPWFKDVPGMPVLPPNFMECNGQEIVDPDSPLDGEYLPDFNTGMARFVRGGLTSGQLGGIDYFATAAADFSGGGEAHNFVTTDFSPGAIPIPPYITAVFVMRIK